MSSITVDSTAALTSALKSAHDGDTILLKAGTYSGLYFSNLTFATGVTITSADAANRAVLTSFGVDNAHGITFSNVEMVTQSTGYFDYIVTNSSNLSFDHVSVHGSLDGNVLNDIEGIQISGSSNISVTNSEFQQLERAMAISTSSNITVANNHVHDVGTTGFMFGQVSNVKITGNVLDNFHVPTGDHPDAIQFLTSNATAPTHDVLISDNVLFRGGGDAFQGIFVADQATTMHY
ncbi:MAG: right-handed parallel beta-helix repeat-containing protein, partial [Phenylobacterium sp.]